MRYLYQQLMAFWLVILVTLLTSGFAFIQLTKQSMETNNYRQLFGYAEAVTEVSKVISDSFSLQDWNNVIKRSLAISEVTLNQQGVNFVFVNNEGLVTYPENNNQPIKFQLPNETWEQLKAGEQQQFTADRDIFGNKELTAYVMVPFNLNNQFFGALVVTQIAHNIQDTVNEFTMNLFKGFAISGFLAVVISYGFAAFQVLRINRMKNAANEVANGNFDIVLPVNHRDEFDELAEDFNKMTQSLKESHEEIDRQEERRRQFMADASHEMRTPLTTINGLLEGLQHNMIPEAQKENAVRLMKNETERLIRLVSENLDYEKIRTNQISIVIKKFDATETVRQLFIQLAKKAAAANNQLILKTNEEIDVFADYDRFVQIMVNILQNAIQFTNNGEIRVSLEKGYLETIITISDTGIGMSEDEVKNIWDRYYKADPSRKNRKFGESGLGLPIVQQLIRLHKGRIEVSSQPNVGTTFKIYFPDTEILEDSKEQTPQ
ncbi:MAG: HAMP domain-containing histidine kinase [Enterococcus sp.]|nr:HAMP domain-containing histidine kinase [Enterococcus sp.]